MYYKFSLTALLLFSIVLQDAKLYGQKTQSWLFAVDDILHCKFTGKLNDLFNDRKDNPASHPVLFQYWGDDSSLVSIQLQVKTRGHFRLLRENCKMPPLLLTFPKEEKLKSTLFDKQTKLKLVVPCQGDEYVIREWLAYKLYNIITEKSFNARLVQVDFEDSAGKRKPETHYCILLEDEKKVAERFSAFVWKRRQVDMRNTDPEEFRKMAVFQYLVGNTDWSVAYLQNIVLITKDSTKAAYAIPYDFDHAGIVDAPYAGAAEELEIPNVRTRLYRGFCESDIESFTKTFELYNRLKKDIYDLYTTCPLLKSSYVKFVTRYFDDFYKIINSNRLIESEFQEPCRAKVRVEIKGLKD